MNVYPLERNARRIVLFVTIVVLCWVAAGMWLHADAKASEHKPFEVEEFTMQTLNSAGTPEAFTQAGGHPWAFTTTLKFSSEKVINASGTEETIPAGDVKDVVVDLPPGLFANPNPRVFPRCPLTFLLTSSGKCPLDTQVGVLRLRWFGGHNESIAPIVNVTPEKGQSAEFGFETAANIKVLLTAHVVREGSSYGLAVVSNSIAMSRIVEAETTFWGVPADPSHNPMRGINCFTIVGCGTGPGVPSGLPEVPFFTMPADCTSGPVTATIRADSWEEPGHFVDGPVAEMPAMTGCDLLQFNPEIEVHPDVLLADAPVGLGVTLKVPQVESTRAPVTPQLRDSVVTLPEGLSINSGIVDGIRACDESGPEGINFEGPLSEETGAG